MGDVVNPFQVLWDESLVQLWQGRGARLLLCMHHHSHHVADGEQIYMLDMYRGRQLDATWRFIPIFQSHEICQVTLTVGGDDNASFELTFDPLSDRVALSVTTADTTAERWDRMPSSDHDYKLDAPSARFAVTDESACWLDMAAYTLRCSNVSDPCHVRLLPRGFDLPPPVQLSTSMQPRRIDVDGQGLCIAMKTPSTPPPALPWQLCMAPYWLQLDSLLAVQPRTMIFSANHQFHGAVAIKMIQTSDDAQSLVRAAATWSKEVGPLKRLLQDGDMPDSIVTLLQPEARFLGVVLQLLPGSDLIALSHGGYCSLMHSQASRIFRDISAALAYIHDRGLVHGDLKPGNIMFSPERGGVLLDFELSYAFDPEHGQTDYNGSGTCWYVDPVCMKEGVIGPQSDVWALGVIMFYAYRMMNRKDFGRRWSVKTAALEEDSDDRRAYDRWHQFLATLADDLLYGRDAHLRLAAAMSSPDWPSRCDAKELVQRLKELEEDGE